MSLASKTVILTTEKITNNSKIGFNPDKVVIPHFLVSAIVEVSKGSAPCGCPKLYDLDDKEINKFMKIDSNEKFDDYLKKYEKSDRQNRLGGRYRV